MLAMKDGKCKECAAGSVENSDRREESRMLPLVISFIVL